MQRQYSQFLACSLTANLAGALVSSNLSKCCAVARVIGVPFDAFFDRGFGNVGGCVGEVALKTYWTSTEARNRAFEGAVNASLSSRRNPPTQEKRNVPRNCSIARS